MTESTYRGCADACNACADACDRCLSACLLEPQVADLTGCIAIDLECAALCRVLAGYAARGSTIAPRLAALCADVCRACADECGRHDHAHCQRCAEACRNCAEACAGLAALPVEASKTAA